MREVTYDEQVEYIPAERLRRMRLRAGYKTQQALAEALGKSLRTITSWEATGSQVPAREVKNVLALLSPGPPPLDGFEDWELLQEIERRLNQRSKPPPSETTGPASSGPTHSGPYHGGTFTGRRGDPYPSSMTDDSE